MGLIIHLCVHTEIKSKVVVCDINMLALHMEPSFSSYPMCDVLILLYVCAVADVPRLMYFKLTGAFKHLYYVFDIVSK